MLGKMLKSVGDIIIQTADTIDNLATMEKRDVVKVIRAQVDTTIDNATVLINNSLKEENRSKIINQTSSGISNAFKVSGKFMGKIANNTLKKAQEGFNSEFNK